MKIFFLLLISALFVSCSYAQENITETNNITQRVIQNSIGLGNVLAITISWSRNKNILFAIIHGILGWLYVIYFAIIDFNKK